MKPIYYALAANIGFSLAIIGFTVFSKKTSVLWTNSFKAVVAAIAFIVSVTLFIGWHSFEWLSVFAFFTSGFIGLAIGDMFLLQAFTLIGPSRTMVLFGFQPIFLGISAYFLFDQDLPAQRLLALFFLIGCLVIFSYERYRQDRHWGFKGILFALAGVILDGCGILLTRLGFDESPGLHAFEGNAYRCLGAIAGFLLLSKYFQPIKFLKYFQELSWRARTVIIIASLMGTFMSLGLYLEAIKLGHLASVTAVAITAPFFSALFESIYLRKWPSKFFLLALMFFVIGFYFLHLHDI